MNRSPHTIRVAVYFQFDRLVTDGAEQFRDLIRFHNGKPYCVCPCKSKIERAVRFRRDGCKPWRSRQLKVQFLRLIQPTYQFRLLFLSCVFLHLSSAQQRNFSDRKRLLDERVPSCNWSLRKPGGFGQMLTAGALRSFNECL
jgi:hypothetical protein